MSNTMVRIITAAVVVPVLVYVFYAGGWPYIVTIELAIALGINEYYRLAQQRGLSPNRFLGTVCALLLALAGAWGHLLGMTVALTLLTLLIIGIRLKSLDLRNVLTGMGVTLFGFIYVGWLLGHAMLLRFPQNPPPNLDLGFFLIVLTIAAIFLADAGAYFVGRAYGRRKLLPFVSPGKTWEGALGGVLGGTAGLLLSKLAFEWFIFQQPTGLSLIHCLLLGPLLVAVSIAGDLAESLMKRDVGVKDSGSIIPGHGGILDRLDSILFALPLIYYYLKLFVYPEVL